jgi:hypothetical protein
MESSFDIDSIKDFDWFDSSSDGVVYVKYMNASVFNAIPSNITLRFANCLRFDTSKYYSFIELE